MKKFVIENDFFEVFPQARIGVIIAKGIDNSIKDTDKYLDKLEASQKMALSHLPNEEFSSNQVIKVWREAFQKFKTKKGARSSIEALLKRASNGNYLGSINPLVDIYNCISLKYGLPCGGEDMDKFVGNIRLTKAIGNESFITLGSDESAPPYEGEIVYKDDEGAICRCWNWRESVRTMLTESTTNAFLCIELVDESRIKDLESALNELSEDIRVELGGSTSIWILDNDNREMEIQ